MLQLWQYRARIQGLSEASATLSRTWNTSRPRRQPPRATNAVITSDQEDWDCWEDDDVDNVQQVASSSLEPAKVNQVSSPPLRCNVRFQRTQVGMEIDTGSCNTLIGEDTYKSLQVRPNARFAQRFAEPAANGTGPYERTRTMGWAARTRKTTRRGAIPRPAPLVWDARGLNRRKQTGLRPIGAAA